MSIPKVIRERLDALSDIVLEDGAAAISSGTDSLFSITQAYAYRNHYEGLKRHAQIVSILEELFEPDDSLYGWGVLGNHEPIVVLTHPAPEINPEAPLTERARIRAIRQSTPARLEIFQRNFPCPNIGMWLIRATVDSTGILIPDIEIERLQRRCSKLQEQIKEPDLREKLGRLKFYPKDGGVLAKPAIYTIERIKT